MTTVHWAVLHCFYNQPPNEPHRTLNVLHACYTFYVYVSFTLCFLISLFFSLCNEYHDKDDRLCFGNMFSLQ